ncbi:MAG: Stp1/IreP family PP2C-type Ser/Thr phosphatase [Chloroflexi bacterium]|nr:Stp1/IreP family PP2C-type Ser/Thr phosphatase [Chloroflexota bacterium]
MSSPASWGESEARSRLRFEVDQATSVGQVRSGNEDSVLCEPLDVAGVRTRGLFCAVADGMGGHAKGEIASSLAVKTARDVYYNADDMPLDAALEAAVSRANAVVYEAGGGATGREHMGSTLTAAVLTPSQVLVGHVGDSRCYLIDAHDGAIRQVTRDHSWVAEEVEAGLLTPEEARVHPRRNIITRALGLRPDVEVDIYAVPLTAGKVVLLCSDGLHGLVTDEEMAECATSMPPHKAVAALVQLANDRGGPDNISVVIARAEADDEALTGPADALSSEDPTPTSVDPPEAGLRSPDETTLRTPIPEDEEVTHKRPAVPPYQAAAPRPPSGPRPSAPSSSAPSSSASPPPPASPPAPAGPYTGVAWPIVAPPATSPSPGAPSSGQSAAQRLTVPPSRTSPVDPDADTRRVRPHVTPCAMRRGGSAYLLTVLLALLILGAVVGYVVYRLSGLSG